MTRSIYLFRKIVYNFTLKNIVLKGNTMHIEPGMVDATKIALSYATASASILAIAKISYDSIKITTLLSFLSKSILASFMVFVFFQVFPHYPVGVSEVHLIMGSTLFLLFGLAPASIGLLLGLLAQGLLFAPFDLPQYGMNITTLIVPLLAISYLAKKIIPQDVAYTQLEYAQVLKLSLVYQGGIVSWVAFWALYGQGFAMANLVAIASFGSAYMLVVIIEPLADLALLALAKSYKNSFSSTQLLEKRLYNRG